MNPFVSALAKKASPKFAKNKNPMVDIPQPPTVFHVNAGDLPGIKKMSPGQKIAVKVHGVIHSLDQDGGAQLHIHRVLLATDKDNESNDDTQD